MKVFSSLLIFVLVFLSLFFVNKESLRVCAQEGSVDLSCLEQYGFDRETDRAFDPFGTHSIAETITNPQLINTNKPLDSNRPELCGLAEGACNSGTPNINNAYVFNPLPGESTSAWGDTQAVGLPLNGQSVYVPPSGRDIGGGNEVLISKLDPAAGTISLQYTLDAGFADGAGNAVNRYDLHLQNVNINQNLVDAYLNKRPDGQLPALPAGYFLGTVNGELRVSMADTGSFMNLLEANDFWIGSGPAPVNDPSLIDFLAYLGCYIPPQQGVGNNFCQPPVQLSGGSCCQPAIARNALEKAASKDSVFTRLVDAVAGLTAPFAEFDIGIDSTLTVDSIEQINAENTYESTKFFASSPSLDATFLGQNNNSVVKKIGDDDLPEYVPLIMKLVSPELVHKYPQIINASTYRAMDEQTSTLICEGINFKSSCEEVIIESLGDGEGLENLNIYLQQPQGDCSGGCYKVSKIEPDYTSGNVSTTVVGENSGTTGWGNPYTTSNKFENEVTMTGFYDPLNGETGNFFAFGGNRPENSQIVMGLGHVNPEAKPYGEGSHMQYRISFERCFGQDCFNTNYTVTPKPIEICTSDYFELPLKGTMLALQNGVIMGKIKSTPEMILDYQTVAGIPETEYFTEYQINKRNNLLAKERQQYLANNFSREEEREYRLAMAGRVPDSQKVQLAINKKASQSVVENVDTDNPINSFESNVQKVREVSGVVGYADSACENPLTDPSVPICDPTSFTQDTVTVEFDTGDEEDCNVGGPLAAFNNLLGRSGCDKEDDEASERLVDVSFTCFAGGVIGCRSQSPDGVSSPNCPEPWDFTEKDANGVRMLGPYGDQTINNQISIMAASLHKTPEDEKFLSQRPVYGGIDSTMANAENLVQNPLKYGYGYYKANNSVIVDEFSYPYAASSYCAQNLSVVLRVTPESEERDTVVEFFKNSECVPNDFWGTL